MSTKVVVVVVVIGLNCPYYLYTREIGISNNIIVPFRGICMKTNKDISLTSRCVLLNNEIFKINNICIKSFTQELIHKHDEIQN